MSVPYDTSSRWQWPEPEQPEEDLWENEDAGPPGAFQEEPVKPNEQPVHDANDADSVPRFQRHYPSRTCRICLEEVPPTLEPLTDGIPSILHPAPKVTYVSSDPESGRLIRPCKCRGSQKYVHEGCLQQWRHADPAYGARNFWECPTCKFRYRLERMRWSRAITSTFTQIIITVAIMLTTIFIFGFIADPIINLYLDPYETITSLPTGGTHALQFEDEESTWLEHFLKGMASLGLLGFVKVIFAMSPWHWLNLRNSGLIGGGRGRAANGRDRMENISWTVVIIGIVTFLAAVWTWVRAWTKSTLEKAGERVVDVQGDDDDIEELDEPSSAQVPPGTASPDASPGPSAEAESRKTQ